MKMFSRISRIHKGSPLFVKMERLIIPYPLQQKGPKSMPLYENPIRMRIPYVSRSPLRFAWGTQGPLFPSATCQRGLFHIIKRTQPRMNLSEMPRKTHISKAAIHICIYLEMGFFPRQQGKNARLKIGLRLEPSAVLFQGERCKKFTDKLFLERAGFFRRAMGRVEIYMFLIEHYCNVGFEHFLHHFEKK